jgi:hypothetical protein
MDMSPADATSSSKWMISPAWDAAVSFSTLWFPALFFVLWRASRSLGLAPAEVSLAVFYGAVSLPHFLTTFTFTWLDPEQRTYYRTRWGLYFAIPSLLIVGCWLHCLLVGPLLLVLLWVLFGEHHVAAQNLGFLALYRQRNGEGEVDRRIDHWVFNSAWVTTAVLFATRPVGKPGLQYFLRPAYLLPLPDRDGVVGVLLLVTTGAFLVFLGRQVWRWRQGLPVSLPKLLFMLTTWPSFIAVPFLVHNLETALIVRSGYHSVQYLGLVELLNRRRVAARGDAGSGLLARLMKAGPLTYFALHIIAGFGVWWVTDVLGTRAGWGSDLSLQYLFIPGVALAHFFLDGLTWRFSDAHVRATVVPYLRQGPPTPAVVGYAATGTARVVS